MIRFNLCFSFLLLLFISCQDENKSADSNREVLTELLVPSKESATPNLFVSESGQVYLSWVEYLNDTTDALKYATLEQASWSTPQSIATGSDWFVNWADFPSFVGYKDGGQTLAAHWLQKSNSGTYDYDVHIAQSLDAGKTWQPSFIPHRDSIAAEHGFVSMLPLSKNRIFATWLDGRNTKGEGHDDGGGHGHHGSMTLRSALFDKAGNLYEETELDNRICDCCQTSAALTDKGVIIAYRDRSEDEIRDISVVRQVNGQWTKPTRVFADNWRIAGCPVNGPAIKANGAFVAIAWYSMPKEEAEIKIAFSEDSGTTFQTPIRIDNGNPLGRIAIELLSDNMALVSWLENTDENAEIRAIKVNTKGKIGNDFLVSKTDAARDSGFPVMVKSGNQIIFAWTHVDDLTHIKTAILKL